MAKQTALEIRAQETTAAAVRKVDIESLLIKAAESNLSPESMRELMAMRRELKQEAAREAFFAALAAFQAKCPPIEKTEIVWAKGAPHIYDPKKPETRKNVRYFFAPLEKVEAQIAPWCKKFGFSYTVGTRVDIRAGEVAAVVKVHHVAGHTEVTEFPVPVDPEAYMSAPQKFASALSFSKRYALVNGFGVKLVGEDNDGDDGTLPEPTKTRRTDPVSTARAREEAPGEQGKAPATSAAPTSAPATSAAPTSGRRDLRQPSGGAPGALIGEKINTTQVGIIEKKMDDASLTGGDFYKRFGIMSVGDLKPPQLQEALDWIKDPIKNNGGAR